jgi:hypothetical protein
MWGLLAALATTAVLDLPAPPIDVAHVEKILSEFRAGPPTPDSALAVTEALSGVVGMLNGTSDHQQKEVGAAVRLAVKALGEALLETQVRRPQIRTAPGPLPS